MGVILEIDEFSCLIFRIDYILISNKHFSVHTLYFILKSGNVLRTLETHPSFLSAYLCLETT